MNTNTSKSLFDRAKKSIPGGVNSPVRSFSHVGGDPLFISRAEGAYLYDADGNRYIDLIGSWGPMLLGHAHPAITEAVREAAKLSTSFGAPTEQEVRMAELVISMVPNVDLIRMVNSGTEACMSALRVARGYTGRNKLIKFEGCYHGHADAFLVKAGSGVATLNIQAVPGVPSNVADDTLTCAFNDLDAVRQLMSLNKDEIAAIIVEPVAGNMGCIPPASGFLEGLREICDKEGIVLIFDEVMTGFRLAAGGAQEATGVNADLITYGKVIGGGMPVGAFGGKKEIMSMVAPLGKVYQAGTLSGNPVAMAAGLAMLGTLQKDPKVYDRLEEKGAYLEAGLRKVMGEEKHVINRFGSMISLHFGRDSVTDLSSAMLAENERFKKFFHAMLKRGVYLPPSPFETWFLNDAMTTADLDAVVEAAKDCLGEV
jgi:glutamate-1-semialdehyde 2,1-aminomutase